MSKLVANNIRIIMAKPMTRFRRQTLRVKSDRIPKHLKFPLTMRQALSHLNINDKGVIQSSRQIIDRRNRYLSFKFIFKFL